MLQLSGTQAKCIVRKSHSDLTDAQNRRVWVLKRVEVYECQTSDCKANVNNKTLCKSKVFGCQYLRFDGTPNTEKRFGLLERLILGLTVGWNYSVSYPCEMLSVAWMDGSPGQRDQKSPGQSSRN